MKNITNTLTQRKGARDMENDLFIALMDVPIFAEKRKPISETDFGDSRTIGLHLKKNMSLQYAQDYDFGIYLGQLKNGKWGVALKTLSSFVPEKLAEYSSLGELKQTWILD
jgi:hypothetical protein